MSRSDKNWQLISHYNYEPKPSLRIDQAESLSILAIVESVVAIVIVVYIAHKWGRVRILLLGGMLLPVFLLHSSAATSLGIRHVRTVVSLVLIAHDKAVRLRYGFLLVVLARTLFVLFAALGSPIVRAVATIAVTIRHPIKSVLAIPKGFQVNIAQIDLFYPYDFIPGVRSAIEDDPDALRRYLKRTDDDKPEILPAVLASIDPRVALVGHGYFWIAGYFLFAALTFFGPFAIKDALEDRAFITSFLVLTGWSGMALITLASPARVILCIPVLAYRLTVKAATSFLIPFAWTVRHTTQKSASHSASDRIAELRMAAWPRFMRYLSLFILLVFFLKLNVHFIRNNIVHILELDEAGLLYRLIAPGEIPLRHLLIALNCVWTLLSWIYLSRPAAVRPENERATLRLLNLSGICQPLISMSAWILHFPMLIPYLLQLLVSSSWTLWE
jgi:hypothetical protein